MWIKWGAYPVPSVPSDLRSVVRDLVRGRDPDRYLCAQFAPPAKREALLALTALGVEVADIPARVTEPAMGQLRVSWWRDALARVEAGDPPAHPVAEALAAVWVPQLAPRCEAILDSCDRAFADRETKEDPAPAIAGRTQQAWLAILGVFDPDAEAAALYTGAAWGLTRRDPPAAALEKAEDHLRRAREDWADIPKAALPALLPGAIAAAVIRRAHRGQRPPGRVRRQLVLLRAALLGRF